MDILIQPLLQRARKLDASLHIRYSTLPTPQEQTAEPGFQGDTGNGKRGPIRMTSYVIIRREYSYLEPLVRSVFGNAEDVKVLIDRRSEEPQVITSTPPDGEARSAVERRASTPMLDILINVES